MLCSILAGIFFRPFLQNKCSVNRILTKDKMNFPKYFRRHITKIVLIFLRVIDNSQNILKASSDGKCILRIITNYTNKPIHAIRNKSVEYVYSSSINIIPFGQSLCRLTLEKKSFSVFLTIFGWYWCYPKIYIHFLSRDVFGYLL